MHLLSNSPQGPLSLMSGPSPDFCPSGSSCFSVSGSLSHVSLPLGLHHDDSWHLICLYPRTSLLSLSGCVSLFWLCRSLTSLSPSGSLSLFQLSPVLSWCVCLCICVRVCVCACACVSSLILTECCSLSLSAFSYFPWLPCTLCTLPPQPIPVSPAAPPACRQAFSPSLGQSSAPALNTQP